MNVSRLLLPFTHGVDLPAIEYTVRLAHYCGATLVVLSLLPASGERRGSVRLEHIQQANDFFEAVRRKAAPYQVPVERHEVVVGGEVDQHITACASSLHCEAMVMVMRARNGVFLHRHEIERLFKKQPLPLLFMRLSSNEERPAGSLLDRLCFFTRRLLRGRQDTQVRVQAYGEREEVGETASEQPERQRELSLS
jgi:hypothetical protein